MSFKKLSFLIALYIFCSVNSTDMNDRMKFLRDFIVSTRKPNSICSYLELDRGNAVTLFKATVDIGTQWLVSGNYSTKNYFHDHVILYLMDLRRSSTEGFLEWASQDKSIFRTPKRWIFFYDVNMLNGTQIQNNEKTIVIEDNKYKIENMLDGIYMGIDTEIHVVIEMIDVFELFLVCRINASSPVVWEHLGNWSRHHGLTMFPKDEVLALRRRNIQGAEVVSILMVTDFRVFDEWENFENIAEQTITKLMYYMMVHLFEWVNGTGVITTTEFGGQREPNGVYSGAFGALLYGTADFCGTIMIPKPERIIGVNFVTSPGKFLARFIFKKPVLASVANIYTLPFSTGVWVSLLILMLVLTFVLFLAYHQEQMINKLYRLSTAQKVSEAFLETFCLVFQQGTAIDPISGACRQILILGLLAFMFLFTAYSANVVALLQSASNDINSIETLMESSYACGAQDVEWAKMSFKTETRPEYRAFFKRKLVPQGDGAYLSIPEGIRRVREGMYAFHVELTAGYDEIQKTFMEDEKCNLGAIKYMSMGEPYLGVAARTHIKESLRIGAYRIIENGLQSRSNRRLLRTHPNCGAGFAVFTAVRTSDVMPAFTCLLIFYAITLIILGLEICVHRRTNKNGN